MLNDSFKYYKVSSYIHSFSPLCKILVFIIFFIMLLFCSSFKSIIALSLVLLFIIGLCNIPYKSIFKPIWCIRYFLLVLLGFCLILGSSVFVFKFCLFIIFYNIFVMSTSVNDLVNGFYSLFLPFKVFGVSIDRCSIYCGMFFYFIPFFIDEYNDYLSVLLSRGFECNSFKDRFYSFIYVFSSTYRKILSKCDIMLIRGISSVDFSFKLTDVYMVMCNLVVLVLVLVKEVVV